MNGHTLGFRLQTQKLKKNIQDSINQVKGLMRLNAVPLEALSRVLNHRLNLVRKAFTFLFGIHLIIPGVLVLLIC